ncbi:MAG: amidase [Rhodospirillaceae bacterium]|nr:amidase [Rhodospirillaceae bacterium]HAA93023.1 amidase [Rhodospirillaceae bacterium]
MPKTHEIAPTPETVHWGYFDGTLQPIHEIASGDRLILKTVSGGPGDLPDDPELEVLPALRDIHEQCKKGAGGHILTGPVAIKDAKPGDMLEVQIADIELHYNWGFNRMRPLSGTLPEDFPDYHMTMIPLNAEDMTASLPWGTDLPLDPFFGVMGTAPPPEWGRQPSTIPRAFGGNLDIKALSKGATLFLPVFVDGAMFSAGDGHGCQGDGEVDGTAIETGLIGTFDIHLHKNKEIAMPRAETETHYISIGIDPSLDAAAKQALREMIAFICGSSNLSPEEAYTLCSLAADMHVSQTVNVHKGIHVMLPKSALHG